MTHRIAACSCRRVQVHVTADPIRVSVCCLACQQRTGSVFAAQARFPSDAVTITGSAREFVYEERMHSWVVMPAGIDHMA